LASSYGFGHDGYVVYAYLKNPSQRYLSDAIVFRY
jgi:hypothetical protein